MSWIRKTPDIGVTRIPRHCGVLYVRLIPRDSHAVSRTFYESDWNALTKISFFTFVRN